MDVAESLAHTKWVCKYHIVFIPKYRGKALYGELRKISIPPKHSVSQVVDFIKGKSAIHIARVFKGRKKNFVGQHFWARGYYVTTVGHDTEVVRRYVQRQEEKTGARTR